MTDTHGPFEVGELKIRRSGSLCALHVSTPVGRFIFRMGNGGFLAALDDSGLGLLPAKLEGKG